MKHSSHALTETHRVIWREVQRDFNPPPPRRKVSLARHFMNVYEEHSSSVLHPPETFPGRSSNIHLPPIFDRLRNGPGKTHPRRSFPWGDFGSSAGQRKGRQ
ncbi:hypothetical protein CDAR_202231 [Caerostris darwini]|uniref:Uncharacterized protein n=1 Tax=Caerostris darwini TaxID=1538125 RepID=A0AAV4SSH6_9ARAC|nr:hypothetical protein CDAR_202231 [Caerostris darwini]